MTSHRPLRRPSTAETPERAADRARQGRPGDNAAMLCGLADGAGLAAAMRHLKLPFFQAIRLCLRAARCGSGTTWRSVTGDRP